MKLVFAIVQDADANKVMNELSKSGYTVTKLSSTGGFLRSGNTTLLVGVPDDYVENVLKIIEKKSKSRKQIINANTDTSSSMGGIVMPMPLEVTVGGATVFVVNVEEYRKY
jgi:uncharacterized protein YaaQ